MIGRLLVPACFFTMAVSMASPALSQGGDDPALKNLNACLSGPTAGSEQDFMLGLNPAVNAPDRVAWCLFLYVSSQAATPGNNNALFETWASDGDTFQMTPVWPGPNVTAMQLRQPILSHLARQGGGGLVPFVLPFQPTQCQQGQLCVGEETRRNKATFDFIVNNKLFTRDGLKAYTKPIVFPADSIEVKANWVPVSQLSDFLAGSGAPTDPSLYHLNTTTENGQQVQYALVSFHVISKMVPNWTWTTFEHMNNPGRCDIIGCVDNFGANLPVTAPHLSPPQGPGPNTQYPNCTKTPALTTLIAANKLDPAFANYCLKGTQVDFTDGQGVATRLGNTVTENGFVDTASCITCHGRSAYSFITGTWAMNRIFLYNSTPIGPIGPLDPGQFFQYPQQDPMRPQDAALFIPADFVWSVPLCALNAQGKSACAAK
jgi:hypothetical protein